MPSLTSYSPFETLAFFQSVAKHGADASALQDISTALTQNEYIRNDDSFDANRFSTDALQYLYDEHVARQKSLILNPVNGDLDNGERSPKRRKLSSTVHAVNTAASEDEKHVQELLEQLYLSYKDRIVREIKRDEEEFETLQKEIRHLEHQIKTGAEQQPQLHSSQTSMPQPRSNKKDSDAQTNQQDVEATQLSGASGSDHKDTKILSTPQDLSNDALKNASLASATANLKSPPVSESPHSQRTSNAQQTRGSQPPTPAPTQHPSPSSFPRQLPSPSPQRAPYVPIHAPSMYSPAQPAQGTIITQVPNVQPRPHPRAQQTPNQGRASPMTYQGQHPYPQYAPYPPPQWHPHMPQTYQQHASYGPPPHYYPQPPNGRHPQTPQQMGYTPYAHTAPMPFVQPQQWRGQQWPSHSVSAVSTPIARSDSRVSLSESGSSTPWRKRAQQGHTRPKSPSRPERAVSPLTDREDSPVQNKHANETKHNTKMKAEDDTPAPKQSRRPGRPPSITPSAMGPSRSQSIASRASELPNERQHSSRRGQKVKTEHPSTPLPVASSDTEQRSSGRRGRPRSSTLASQTEGSRNTLTKRKRDTISPASPVRSPQVSVADQPLQRIDQPHDPSLIIVSRNFGRTSQLLLNEITSHKLAGIFAKPLSERDAPGYKDLIKRPQDLKNIKAAISKGNRAALAAIEAFEGESEATPTRSQPASATAGSGALGNGFYLVLKTDDLVPPRGIVNSAQLEMELVRMFANAVMFNPLPVAERGFGRGLRLRRNGGDIDADADPEEVSSEESESGSLSGYDEGGIISDAREMFNDIVLIVGKWRELEGERMGPNTDVGTSRHASLATPAMQSGEAGRYASASASSNVGDEDIAGGESEAPNTPIANTTSATGRKRRKIAEYQ